MKHLLRATSMAVEVPRWLVWVLVAAAGVVVMTAATAAVVWAVSRPAVPSRVGDAVCAVVVSGTPVPGTPTTLPDGTGTCAP